MERVKAISEKFHAQLDSIIGLMMPDIIEVFGDFSVDEVKERLGKPVIDCDNGQVNYFEQSFDDTHIFTFEFMDLLQIFIKFHCRFLLQIFSLVF